MLSLNGLIHDSVAEVSVLLLDSRYSNIFAAAAAEAPSSTRMLAVLEQRESRTAEYRGKLSVLRRALRSSVEDAFRLVELGGVLAKSAKIEAAYGAAFSVSLSQVSNEFDGIVEEIRASLDTLRKSRFFRG
jgi:predicted deacylase